MQPSRWLATLSLLLTLTAAAGEPSGIPKTDADVLAMTSVPDGHYLVNLQQGGQERRINLMVKGNSAGCVSSTDPKLKGLEGTFESIGNGVFLIVLRNENHTASQWWLFRKDGIARVKEVPDRGEKQEAVPVSGSTLERPSP